ncbi:hypothetical protein TSUD_210690 [Trifolium subterraneum]|uniref:Uncharacterized protein n=1 Tax=Trifolium subterraneum TaxID=3900 RepID=A0A2Z6N2K4_TRISU|nr:hypothetical protein TSUD_210690 [Trifolium subterraneum]
MSLLCFPAFCIAAVRGRKNNNTISHPQPNNPLPTTTHQETQKTRPAKPAQQQQTFKPGLQNQQQQTFRVQKTRLIAL